LDKQFLGTSCSYSCSSQSNSEAQLVPLKNDSSISTKAVVYNVQPGDTLWGLSQKYLGTGKKYDEIQSINHLTEDTIHPGQTILIPQNLSSGWVLYNVKSGDTLWNLAKTYLGSWTKYNILMSLNNLQNEKIYPGQILKIPIKNQNNIYTVQPGDNLWGIALKLLGDGNRYYDIISLNNLNSEQVVEGQKLIIPEL
jgi:nucleoid-associated protein YgaU